MQRINSLIVPSSDVPIREEIRAYFKSLKQRSEETHHNYIRWIREICVPRDLSGVPLFPLLVRKYDREAYEEQVLDIAEAFASLALTDRRAAKLRLVNWLSSTKNLGTTCSSMMASVYSMLDDLEIYLPKKNINRAAPKMVDPDVPGAPREAVKKLYSMLDLRGRVMLGLALVSERVGAYKWFQFKYLTEHQVLGHRIGRLVIYPAEAEEYPSYLTPETMDNIDLYRSARKIAGEVLTGDSPLVRNRFDGATRVLPMKPGVAAKLFWQWWAKYGYPTRHQIEQGAIGTPREWAQYHGFRKFGETELENGGMSHEDAELILGHRYRYKKTEEKDRMENFVRAITNPKCGLIMSDEWRAKNLVAQKDEEITGLSGQIMKLAERIGVLENRDNLTV